MKKPSYNVLSLAIFAACYSQTASADFHAQCLAGVPQFNGELVQGEALQLPVYIEADQAQINQPQQAVYSGNVEIKQGNRQVLAQEVRLTQQHSPLLRHAQLQGQVSYRDHLIQANGQQASLDLVNKTAELHDVGYQLVGRLGRGSASQVYASDERRVLKNASFTSCLPNDNAWLIEAKEMIQHVNEEYAELWHARFNVLGVPIFYSPYLQFPIGDRPRSGLLIPNAGHSSRSGYFYAQPVYWHIAPNVDATFTPTYYTRRGWQITPEFRYLTRLGEGRVAAEYMPRDRLSSWSEKSKSRHLLFWQHQVNFLSHWRFAADYTRVSDSRYFADFHSPFGYSTDGYATQNLKLGYFQPQYNFSVAMKRYQTFDESGSKPYRVFPQIEFNYYQNDIIKHGDLALFGQLSRFENDDKQMPTAWRLHLEPALNFPFANRFGSLNIETKMYATQYWQQPGKSEQAEAIAPRVSRVLPQVKLDFKTTLEANKPLFRGFTQVIEPRIQYLYRPYRDQGNIGSKSQRSLGLGYDSALLQQDYFSLFNDRRYSGLDRIASANQLTLGGTTRFFRNKTGEEVFNFSAGQIYYFRPSKVDNNSVNSTTGRSSSWSLESNWKFHPKWNWHGAYQYDTRLSKTALANMSLQFKPTADKIVQANYRYASRSYIDQNLSTNRYGQNIKQIGVIVGWGVTDHIGVMASHYHDLALKKNVESQFGVTYSTCCWQVNVYAARHLINTPTGKPDGRNHFYYDNRFGVNFELRFGRHGEANGVNRMMQKGIIPYTEAFNIN